MSEHKRTTMRRTCLVFLLTVVTGSFLVLTQFQPALGQPSPSTYNAYTGTASVPIPPATYPGPANSVITESMAAGFSTRILRATDGNTALNGRSMIAAQAGFFRTWNVDSTAIRLEEVDGTTYWLDFDPITFSVGTAHQLRPGFNPNWEWSAVDPNIIYFLNATTNNLAKYNKSTDVSTDLAGPPTGHPVQYHAVVVGSDNWVCSAAGSGGQNFWLEIFCVNPTNPATTTFIDVPNKTINGVPQTDPNWPTTGTSGCNTGQTVIGIHSISGGSGSSWLGVTFHCRSWGGNGDAVFNLTTNTWSLLKDQFNGGDAYFSGHYSLGNGKFVNGGGSQSGQDSRGAIVRNPDNLNDASSFFIMQPPPDCSPPGCWYDTEHSSWVNSASNANAPVLFSRYSNPNPPSGPPAWSDEIIAAAADPSNTVWRFAHNQNGFAIRLPIAGPNVAYYHQAFAQISPNGKYAAFSSYWGGTLGAPCATPPCSDFDPDYRIDTFIAELPVP